MDQRCKISAKEDLKIYYVVTQGQSSASNNLTKGYHSLPNESSIKTQNLQGE